MDTLNLDYHIKRLVSIALEKYKFNTEQATALGINVKTLSIYRKKYGL